MYQCINVSVSLCVNVCVCVCEYVRDMDILVRVSVEGGCTQLGKRWWWGEVTMRGLVKWTSSLQSSYNKSNNNHWKLYCRTRVRVYMTGAHQYAVRV